MMNSERANRYVSIALGFGGLILSFFSAGFYFFLREDWQIVLAFVGMALIGFGQLVDNE